MTVDFLSDFEDKMKKLTDVRNKIQSGVTFKENFAKDIKVKLSAINSRIKMLNDLIVKFKSESRELEKNITNNNNHIGNKETQVKLLTEQVSKLTKENEDLTVKLNQNKRQTELKIADLQHKIDEYETKLRELTQQIENKSTELNALRDEMKKSGDTQAIEYSEQLKNMGEQSKKQLQEQSDILTEKINTCESKINEFTKQIEYKETDVVNKQKQINDMKNQMQLLQNQIADMKKLNDDLIIRLTNATQAINIAADDLQYIANSAPNAQTKQEVDDLLQQITSQIEQSIENIGRAAQGQPIYDVNSNYNNLMNLYALDNKQQFLSFMKTLSGNSNNQINTAIKQATQNNPMAIQQIKSVLNDNKIIVKPPVNIGGKKHRKNIKTHKKYKGGFVYKKNTKRKSILSSIISKSNNKLKLL